MFVSRLEQLSFFGIPASHISEISEEDSVLFRRVNAIVHEFLETSVLDRCLLEAEKKQGTTEKRREYVNQVIDHLKTSNDFEIEQCDLLPFSLFNGEGLIRSKLPPFQILVFALTSGQYSMFSKMLQYPNILTEIEAQPILLNEMLNEAAKRGWVRIVQEILTHPSASTSEFTVLDGCVSSAIEHGQTAVLKELLNHPSALVIPPFFGEQLSDPTGLNIHILKVVDKGALEMLETLLNHPTVGKILDTVRSDYGVFDVFSLALERVTKQTSERSIAALQMLLQHPTTQGMFEENTLIKIHPLRQGFHTALQGKNVSARKELLKYLGKSTSLLHGAFSEAMKYAHIQLPDTPLENARMDIVGVPQGIYQSLRRFYDIEERLEPLRELLALSDIPPIVLSVAVLKAIRIGNFLALVELLNHPGAKEIPLRGEEGIETFSIEAVSNIENALLIIFDAIARHKCTQAQQGVLAALNAFCESKGELLLGSMLRSAVAFGKCVVVKLILSHPKSHAIPLEGEESLFSAYDRNELRLMANSKGSLLFLIGQEIDKALLEEIKKREGEV